MVKSAITIAMLVSLFIPTVATAHPGHGPDHGVSHYLADPYHLVMGIVIAVIGVVFITVIRRIVHRFPLLVRRRG